MRECRLLGEAFDPLRTLLHRQRHLRRETDYEVVTSSNPTLKSSPHHPKVVPETAKRPPGNRVASSLGRIVPTEAKPSELSGEILSLAK
jgi:hypothetical protein